MTPLCRTPPKKLLQWTPRSRSSVYIYKGVATVVELLLIIMNYVIKVAILAQCSTARNVIKFDCHMASIKIITLDNRQINITISVYYL